jgi:hypothetical protein
LALLFSHKSISNNKRQVAGSLLTVSCIPAVIHYEETKLRVKELALLEDIKQIEQDNSFALLDLSTFQLTKYRSNIEALQSLRADIRANENVLEHFVQLVLVLVVLALQRTSTKNVVGMDKIFLNNNDVYIVLSAIWSFYNLLQGQAFYIESGKANFLPVIGKLIILSYFAFGISGRLVAVLLFFTPRLGLCDTNYHGYLGNLEVEEQFRTISNNTVLYRLFDYKSNKMPIFFWQLWKKHQSLGVPQYISLPVFAYVVPLALISFHVLMGLILLLKINKHSKVKLLKRMFHTLYAFMCPPLFLDWEMIYRDSKGLTLFKDSWIKSQKFLIFHIIMHFLEHVSLCVPLILLKTSIDDRNKELAESFPPVKDELYSTYIVNILIGIGIGAAFLLPTLQYGLAHLYFTKGHPWSKILNRTLTTA